MAELIWAPIKYSCFSQKFGILIGFDLTAGECGYIIVLQ